MKEVHNFAVKWLDKFRNQQIDYIELVDHYLADDCDALGFEIKLRNEMKQAAIAKECAQWLEKKAEIKSLRQANPAQPRLVYIENPEDNVSINGTVDFTSDGLGTA